MDETDARYRGRKFVADTVSATGMPDLEAYARALNAKMRSEPLPPRESGYTLLKGSVYIITVNSNDSPERQRFTVCHEIAHIALKLPTEHHDVPSWAYAKRHLNEVWCDIFASELLMPYEVFRKRIPDGDPTVDAIGDLGRQFGASFPATASRYASLAPFPCAYATMDSGIVRFAEPNAALRRKGLRCTMKCPIPPGSVAARLRAASQSASVTGQVAQDLWLENCETGAEIWELSRHYGEFDWTVSLLWCGEDELPRGEVDRFNRRVNDDDGGLEELSGEITWEKHGPRRRR